MNGEDMTIERTWKIEDLGIERLGKSKRRRGPNSDTGARSQAGSGAHHLPSL